MDLSSSALQLQRLLQLRWVEVCGQALAVVVALSALGLPLRTEAHFAVCLLLVAANLFSYWRLSRPWPVSNGELFAQLCLDVAGLVAQLYLAGGSSNPFVSLLLVPLTVAATLLPLGWIWAMAAVTVVAYSTLLLWNIPLPTPRSELAGLNDFICTVTGIDRSLLSHDNGFSLHIIGMWVNFILSALIITVFISRLAALLRQRDRALARAREQTLHHEQILALGTLAAGAAHQLGTPLATMAVVLGDLQLDHGSNPALAEELGLLRQQVDHCKNILAQLVRQVDQADSPSPRPLAILTETLLDEWTLLRPGIALDLAQDDDIGADSPQVMVDATLHQALLNLLDNAADAHRQSGTTEHLRLQVRRQGRACILEILDRGPGIRADVAQRLGEPFISTKGGEASSGAAVVGGMGIGFFLSNATLERLGGRVELFNREGGGACTRIILPCMP
ncbi:MAG: sensor histidine kinase [Rhodocyclaceae bacterium]|nr:MAG: sensor histidine kinase [Rhodocyclaceae bacterium]